MRFEATAIAGAWLVSPEPAVDERGYFARLWCRDEFAARGIDIQMPQASVSYSRTAGTVRGLHFAKNPALEGKLVRCQRGRIFDVLVDLRADSSSYLTHVAVELDAERHVALYVPPGVAHGFQTLMDGCEVHYMMSEPYRPDLAAGVRHDDPAFGINWPLPVSAIAERDRGYPNFQPQRPVSAVGH